MCVCCEVLWRVIIEGDCDVCLLWGTVACYHWGWLWCVFAVRYCGVLSLKVTVMCVCCEVMWRVIIEGDCDVCLLWVTVGCYHWGWLMCVCCEVLWRVIIEGDYVCFQCLQYLTEHAVVYSYCMWPENDVCLQCLQYLTEHAQDLKKLEKLTSQLMRHMAAKWRY